MQAELFPGIEHTRNVIVIQSRGGLSFILKSLDRRLIQ